MSKLVSRRFLVLLSGALLAPVLMAPALAAPKAMTAPMSGAAEIPPVKTPGKGTAMLSFDPATRTLTWTIEFSDLGSPATMAHFHGPAQPGKNAPPTLWIVEKGVRPVSPMTGSAVLTPEQAKDFTDGLWYLNVHTQDNPSGEIRGVIPAVK